MLRSGNLFEHPFQCFETVVCIQISVPARRDVVGHVTDLRRSIPLLFHLDDLIFVRDRLSGVLDASFGGGEFVIQGVAEAKTERFGDWGLGNKEELCGVGVGGERSR